MIKAHIYSPESWHGDAYIVADRVALAGIREAVIGALHGVHCDINLFASDGEGYTIHVILLDDEAKWNKLAPAYRDGIAGQWRDGDIAPWELVPKEAERG